MLRSRISSSMSFAEAIKSHLNASKTIHVISLVLKPEGICVAYYTICAHIGSLRVLVRTKSSHQIYLTFTLSYVFDSKATSMLTSIITDKMRNARYRNKAA